MTDVAPQPRASVCPVCGSDRLTSVFRLDAVPVNSCILVDSAEEARALPMGELDLSSCARCGHLWNARFRADLAQYTDRYEDSQAFSPTFLAYARELARAWVTAWRLEGRTVVEIGAGRADFSRILVEAGVGTVIAMDPTITSERAGDDGDGRLVWLAQQFDQPGDLPACDAVVFRHVLEHVDDPVGLLTALREALATHPSTPVLVEIPDAQRILDEGAFWDVYYEHCAYFTADTARALFTSCGFEVHSVTSTYSGQYLLVAATPCAHVSAARPPADVVVDSHRHATEFGALAEAQRLRYTAMLAARAARDEDVVLWGSGSKATAFSTLVGTANGAVSRVVDVNPHKQGRFVLGAGLPIVSPQSLAPSPPALVVVMNPVYVPEITDQLHDLGVDAQIISVGEPEPRPGATGS